MKDIADIVLLLETALWTSIVTLHVNCLICFQTIYCT